MQEKSKVGFLKYENTSSTNTKEKLMNAIYMKITANKLRKKKYLFIIFRHGIFLARNFQLERENERERKYVLCVANAIGRVSGSERLASLHKWLLVHCSFRKRKEKKKRNRKSINLPCEFAWNTFSRVVSFNWVTCCTSLHCLVGAAQRKCIRVVVIRETSSDCRENNSTSFWHTIRVKKS